MSKRNNLEVFLSSYAGRRFFNFFYSWGAAVVIIGALFKILHLPYANEVLMVGMITEALVFIVSGFDSSSYADSDDNGSPRQKEVVVASGAENKFFSPEYASKMSQATQNMDDFSQIMGSLNEVSLSLLNSYKKISEKSQSVSDDSQGFSNNIKSLNQNVLGLNNIYESQLQSISDQIATIKYINESLDRIKNLYDNTVNDSTAFKEETEKMTRQIEALNKVYARLLQAMTTNNPS